MMLAAARPSLGVPSARLLVATPGSLRCKAAKWPAIWPGPAGPSNGNQPRRSGGSQQPWRRRRHGRGGGPALALPSVPQPEQQPAPNISPLAAVAHALFPRLRAAVMGACVLAVAAISWGVASPLPSLAAAAAAHTAGPHSASHKLLSTVVDYAGMLGMFAIIGRVGAAFGGAKKEHFNLRDFGSLAILLAAWFDLTLLQTATANPTLLVIMAGVTAALMLAVLRVWFDAAFSGNAPPTVDYGVPRRQGKEDGRLNYDDQMTLDVAGSITVATVAAHEAAQHQQAEQAAGEAEQAAEQGGAGSGEAGGGFGCEGGDAGAFLKMGGMA